MSDISEHIESFLKDSTPFVLFLTEDKNKNSLFNSFTQASIDKSGSDSPRLQYVSLNEIPDFTGLTIDYIGPKLIHGDSFLTYPGSIVIYIELLSLEQCEKDEYLLNIENNLSYFAKDLNPFIINQTKIILLLNVDTNAPNSTVITTAIKNFGICTIDHILCFYNEDMDKNIKKAEELCYSLNILFRERHIRHLKKLELVDSPLYKNNPDITTIESNKWESLKYSYIGHVQELMKDNKNSFKNYDIAWNIIKNNYGTDNSDNIDIINESFTIPDDYYDILVIRLIKIVILVKSQIDKHNIGLLLRDIVQCYYKLVTNNNLMDINTNPTYLYKFARLHYFISEKLSSLDTVLGLKLEIFKFKPYHMFTAGKYTFMLQQLIKSKNNDHDNSITIPFEYGINALENAFNEFSTVGWNAHSYLTLILLFKFYMLENQFDNASSAFNKIYQNSLYNHHIHTNPKQIDITSNENVCANCMWRNMWDINDDILSCGKKMPSNKIGWLCTALKAFGGDTDAIRKINDGITTSKILSYIPLQLNIPSRATIFISDEIILLEFKLSIAGGFYSSSGQLKYQIEEEFKTCSFTFEPITNNKHYLIGLLEENNDSNFDMDLMELESVEYNLILIPFDNINDTILSKSVQVLLYVGINDPNKLTLFSLSIPLVVQSFVYNPKLIKSIGWPRDHLKYELPYSKRPNSVVRSSVKVNQITKFWVNKFAPITLEFDVYNCTLPHQDIRISLSNCDVTPILLDENNSFTNNYSTNNSCTDNSSANKTKHFTYRLNVAHRNMDKQIILQIQTGPYDLSTTKIELDYHEGLDLAFRKETVSPGSIGISEFVNYYVKATNLTETDITIVKLSYDDKCITPEDFGMSDDLLPGESCVLLLNDHIQPDAIPNQIKFIFKFNDFNSDSSNKSHLMDEWIAIAELNESEIDSKELEISCTSDGIAWIGTEFNYQAQIKNNTPNTQELQLKLNQAMELLVSGPIAHNIILLPYDSKLISWKMVSIASGYIKLPSITIGKKRWIHQGDDQVTESASSHICVLPNMV